MKIDLDNSFARKKQNENRFFVKICFTNYISILLTNNKDGYGKWYFTTFELDWRDGFSDKLSREEQIIIIRNAIDDIIIGMAEMDKDIIKYINELSIKDIIT